MSGKGKLPGRRSSSEQGAAVVGALETVRLEVGGTRIELVGALPLSTSESPPEYLCDLGPTL